MNTQATLLDAPASPETAHVPEIGEIPARHLPDRTLRRAGRPRGFTVPTGKVLKERPNRDGHIPVLNPLVAVRSHCVQCVETFADVTNCCSTTCALWPYRFGQGYNSALRDGLTVDPNSPEAHVLRDAYRKRGGS